MMKLAAVALCVVVAVAGAGGLRTLVYSNSLLIVMAAIWRQRGSSQSKPAGEPRVTTGAEG
jgi:hypothetical protein